MERKVKEKKHFKQKKTVHYSVRNIAILCIYLIVLGILGLGITLYIINYMCLIF